MSNLSRSQSSERMHVVSAPISATCVCRRLVPSNIWISLFLTSDAEEPGGSAIAARTVAAREAATRRVIRARETNAGALAVTARDAREAEADILVPCRQRQRRNVTNGPEERGARAGGWGSRARSRVDVRRVLADGCALSLLGGNSDVSTVDAVAVVATVVDLNVSFVTPANTAGCLWENTWINNRVENRYPRGV